MEIPSIALLTDFGERDGFTGVVKGVIYSLLHKPVPIIDISHQIARQNIKEGAWVLEHAFPYFGPDTVFMAVVDPGVGSVDQASLLCWLPDKRQFFIAPDNGLLSPVLDAAGARLEVYDIRQSDFYKLSATGRSQTFHGRDVYAPIAAMAANALLSGNVTGLLAGFGRLGEPKRLNRSMPERLEGNRFLGEVLHIDTYGNCITSIPAAWLGAGSRVQVTLGRDNAFETECRTSYQEALGCPEPILLPSSGGTLELSVPGGSAAQTRSIRVGDSLLLQLV